ncbi:hypothetical protein [Pyrobaculum ferrireducens]|uniref:Uncharacterized protein n=1 Tax=Pyrobaculum ferrireducens TaxID=1104324 RepID=G7VF31_9CREN|nr:hypothetical protein [Pyrobaculum ferrireducens]AET34196.1 hypothetical protein P186_2820 [Pyrobaculum ferrireducens]
MYQIISAATGVPYSIGTGKCCRSFTAREGVRSMAVIISSSVVLMLLIKLSA